MKPKLILNEQQAKRPGSTLGMKELLGGLATSDLFDISFHKENVSTMRGERATLIYYNDRKIYLDLWEYPTPTNTMSVYNENFDLIIKIQHKKMPFKRYNRYCTRKGLLKSLTVEQKEAFWNKMIPWTFFPSRLMRKEWEYSNIEIERDAFFCGKAWKCRHNMVKALESQNIECVKSSQELKRGRPLNDKEYIHKMLSSRYGLILAGRASIITDCKNRREIDYLMMKKPLLLNYEPYYYDDFIKGVHYIKIDENTDISSLKDMYNIEEIANNGYEWYKRNASEDAIPKTFLKIMKDKFEKE
jgi:hypothetical protein